MQSKNIDQNKEEGLYQQKSPICQKAYFIDDLIDQRLMSQTEPSFSHSALGKILQCIVCVHLYSSGEEELHKC